MSKHKKKYILHSGYVRSQSDNQWHFISGKMLIGLYKLDEKECRIMGDNEPSYDNGSAIHLFPRHTGDYTLLDQDNEPITKKCVNCEIEKIYAKFYNLEFCSLYCVNEWNVTH